MMSAKARYFDIMLFSFCKTSLVKSSSSENTGFGFGGVLGSGESFSQ